MHFSFAVANSWQRGREECEEAGRFLRLLKVKQPLLEMYQIPKLTYLRTVKLTSFSVHLDLSIFLQNSFIGCFFWSVAGVFWFL